MHISDTIFWVFISFFSLVFIFLGILISGAQDDQFEEEITGFTKAASKNEKDRKRVKNVFSGLIKKEKN